MSNQQTTDHNSDDDWLTQAQADASEGFSNSGHQSEHQSEHQSAMHGFDLPEHEGTAGEESLHESVDSEENSLLQDPPKKKPNKLAAVAAGLLGVLVIGGGIGGVMMTMKKTSAPKQAVAAPEVASLPVNGPQGGAPGAPDSAFGIGQPPQPGMVAPGMAPSGAANAPMQAPPPGAPEPVPIEMAPVPAPAPTAAPQPPQRPVAMPAPAEPAPPVTAAAPKPAPAAGAVLEQRVQNVMPDEGRNSARFVSIERRLDRIEAMLEKLASQPAAKVAGGGVSKKKASEDSEHEEDRMLRMSKKSQAATVAKNPAKAKTETVSAAKPESAGALAQYSLQGAYPLTGGNAQAWLKDASGKIIVVGVGDVIEGAKVNQIDTDGRKVVTSAGTIR